MEVKKCSICFETRRIDNAHFPTPEHRGGTTIIPLCPNHHTYTDGGMLRIVELFKLYACVSRVFGGDLCSSFEKIKEGYGAIAIKKNHKKHKDKVVADLEYLKQSIICYEIWRHQQQEGSPFTSPADFLLYVSIRSFSLISPLSERISERIKPGLLSLYPDKKEYESEYMSDEDITWFKYLKEKYPSAFLEAKSTAIADLNYFQESLFTQDYKH